MLKSGEFDQLAFLIPANEMSLYPYAGAHAVQSAAFALEWPVELNEVDFVAVAALHEKLKTSLPVAAPIQRVTFQMVPGQAGSTTANALAGHTFSRLGAAGPARVLEVQANRVVGQVNDYTRWEPVWKEVGNWFKLVGPIIGKRQITNVGLQYNDVFHWRDDPQSLDLTQIFREDSVLLPRNVFALNGLWHSHHGYFVERTAPIPHRLLENVNVNLLEELGQRSVVISTVHKAEVSNVWGWENMAGNIDSLMADLHQRNKVTLGNLLSTHAAGLIGLDKENQ